MPTSTPWDIYAHQLFSLGYGHPLWIPEPSFQDHSSTQREVHIGDVGYLREGEFHPLFNSTRSDSHPSNTLGVPNDFIPFDTTNVVIRPCRKVVQGRLCSGSVQVIQASGELGGGGVPSISANVGFEFESRLAWDTCAR
ncbi:hypothetical protein C8Q80DRAFT_1192478 [Daedaleopsis nitida]|nr:hypothetical protein C8Q80DRAFT_1192478 [Daedaleopsis nitida]